MQSKYETKVVNVLQQSGFTNNIKIASTLQGQIWKSYRRHSNEEFVIKVTSKQLHETSSIVLNGKTLQVQENILREKQILKYLSSAKKCPQSIIKYKGFFQSENDYYLLMANGGISLFDFVVKLHKLVKLNMVEILEWHKLAKIIFKQMIEAIEFMHQHNVTHFDISLENTLINDVDISVTDANTSAQKIVFENYENVQISIIDFGLAEIYDKRDNFQSNKYCGKRNYQCPEIVNKADQFNAASNDVWCAGVCLFMIMSGTAPFHRAHDDDKSYKCIIDGHLKHLLHDWQRLSYFDEDLLDLLAKILQLEDKRISVQEIKQHRWLRNMN